MPVLVYEPSISGHRAYYASVLTKKLRELGCNVKLAVADDALDQPEGQEFFAGMLADVEYIPLERISPNLSVFKTSRAKLLQLKDVVSKVDAAHCYVPYADGISQAWGASLNPDTVFAKDVVIEGLMMRGAFAYPLKSLRQRYSAKLSWLLSRRARWTRLHHLDPLAMRVIKKHSGGMTDDQLMPEIIETQPSIDANQARKELGVGISDFVIACPGAVTESKGIDQLIKAIRGIRNQDNLKLVLLGKHSPGVCELLNEQPDARIITINRFASSDEFASLFAIADTIAVCYPRHIGSSSILLRAAKANKRIVASDWGWIGWATKTFHLGETCDSTVVESVRDALLKTIDNKPKHISNSSLTEEFLNYHSAENHLAHWTSLYCQKYNLPQDKRVKFEKVLAMAGTHL